MFVLYKAKISGERLQDHWSSGFACEPLLLAYVLSSTLTRYENATVELIASFHEKHMTVINISLPKFLSNQLSIRQ